MTVPAVGAAVALLTTAAAQVHDIVVCPGSRSQAFALVAAELEALGTVRLHVRFDERSAAFFALGLARESGRPVPVIVTSGTAVANLHPAMLEAHHAGIPLVAITADRPAELVGTGANQTTLQDGIFGPLLPTIALPAPTDDDAADGFALWRELGERLAATLGPLHLNLAMREPLSGELPELDAPNRFRQRPVAPEHALPDDGDRRIHFGSGPMGLSDKLAAAIAAELAAYAKADAAASPKPELVAQPGASDARVQGQTGAADAASGSGAADAASGSGAATGSDAATGSGAASGSGAADAASALSNAASPLSNAVVRAAQDQPAAASQRAALTDQPQHPRILEIDPVDYPRTVVLAGDRAGAEAERTARQGGWPLIAEVSSGARFGRNVVVAYRDLLGAESPVPGLRDSIELVIVYGHPTLSRQTSALLTKPGVRVAVVDDPAAPPLRPGGEEHVDQVRVTAFAATQLLARTDAAELRAEADAWLQGWLAASRELERARDTDPEAPDIEASRSTDAQVRARFGRAELAVSREPVNRAMLADAVWRATWPHDRLVVAASRLIRDLDAQVPGKRIRVHANRGLAGIDGTIATALGVATASQFGGDAKSATGTTRLVIGDIAFAHDASSLLVAQGGEPAPRMQIIVGVDGGGSLFDALEVRQTAAAERFERVQFTPLTLDIEAVARAYGWDFARADTRGKLEEALTDQRSPRCVIAVPLPR